MACTIGRCMIDVSIHAPARGATASMAVMHVGLMMFQSTPPRGGRPDTVAPSRRAVAFQSTPPRGGRRRPDRDTLAASYVSIHAPARGATVDAAGHHAIADACFNPRPRAGGDAPTAIAWIDGSAVSIHAPARGATRRISSSSTDDHRCFNPRPRAGGDLHLVTSYFTRLFVPLSAHLS